MAADIDLRRLALVCSTRPGTKPGIVGTGCFVTPELVLTTSDAVPAEPLEALQVRTENDGQWHDAEIKAEWRDEALNAVLIRVKIPVEGLPDVIWAEEKYAENTHWQSSGFPTAGRIEHKSLPACRAVGLKGTLNAIGGDGQRPLHLELVLDDPPAGDSWQGTSGAPIFVDGRLAGFIKQVPPSLQGAGFTGVPATALLQSHGLRLALTKRWLPVDALPEKAWVLVVLREAGHTQLDEWVKGTLKRDHEAIEAVVGGSLSLETVPVKITEAIQSPGRWLQFTRALCAAPIAVFDATGFEPAMMIALGVRAVVRRGVTITSTARELTPDHWSDLPFNIKETKLVYHGGAYKLNDDKHPFRAIAGAIKRGWQELHEQPSYLDLPAYDGVRCAYPTTYKDDSAVERILVLCPFGEEYDRNWLMLSNALTLEYATRQPVRMLDIASPRLVGQALYEGIRWSTTCLVDWTGWRANVFFEFGVRLACAAKGPICVLEPQHGHRTSADGLTQKQQLIDLWCPRHYSTIREEEDAAAAATSRQAIADAFSVHNKIVDGNPPPLPTTALPHDATYQTCVDFFQWAQEGITIDPHDWLQRSVQDPFGHDPQSDGRKRILYSPNPNYSAELGRSVRERWIAAWYYLSNRYPKSKWAIDATLRRALRQLANNVLLYGARKTERDPHLQSLRESLEGAIDLLDDMDKASVPEAGTTA
jgi:hypothetical protein